MSNILNTEEEVRNFLLSSPVEDVDPSAHLFVAVIKARLIRAQRTGLVRYKVLLEIYIKKFTKIFEALQSELFRFNFDKVS